MIRDLHVEVHFLFKLSLQTVARPFTEFQPAAGELGIIVSADEFIADEDLLVFSDQKAVNSEVDHSIIILRPPACGRRIRTTFSS